MKITHHKKQETINLNGKIHSTDTNIEMTWITELSSRDFRAVIKILQ